MKDIIVVSGLPRSGTSLMMRMLEAGGVPVLTDHLRGADESNPDGYYEYEPVKRTRVDSSWVPNAQGKAVKVIYALLPDLPAGYRYRIILMRRDAAEVVASQMAMLGRLGQAGASGSPEELAQLLTEDLTRVLSLVSPADLIEIDYAACLRTPEAVAARLNTFLGGGLDTEAMATIPNPALYRQRKS